MLPYLSIEATWLLAILGCQGSGQCFFDHLPHIVNCTGMHMDSLVVNSLLDNELSLSVRTGQVLDSFGIAQGAVDFGSI